MITEEQINEYSRDPKFIQKLDEWLPEFRPIKQFRFFFKNDMMNAEILMLENLRIINKVSPLSANQRKMFSELFEHLVNEFEDWKKNGDNPESAGEA